MQRSKNFKCTIPLPLSIIFNIFFNGITSFHMYIVFVIRNFAKLTLLNAPTQFKEKKKTTKSKTKYLVEWLSIHFTMFKVMVSILGESFFPNEFSDIVMLSIHYIFCHCKVESSNLVRRQNFASDLYFFITSSNLRFYKGRVVQPP